MDYAVQDVQDDDATALAVTNLVTAISLVSGFASGTKLVFYQTTAPINWTKDTTRNDMALRVVSGAGGGIGGTHDFSTPPSTAHTHTGPSHTHSGVDHTHGFTGVDHLHAVTIPLDGYGGDPSYVAWGRLQTDNGGNVYHATSAPSTNTGAADRSLAGSTVGADRDLTTGAAGTGATGSGSPTQFAPKYIDVIVAIKD